MTDEVGQKTLSPIPAAIISQPSTFIRPTSQDTFPRGEGFSVYSSVDAFNIPGTPPDRVLYQRIPAAFDLYCTHKSVQTPQHPKHQPEAIILPWVEKNSSEFLLYLLIKKPLAHMVCGPQT